MIRLMIPADEPADNKTIFRLIENRSIRNPYTVTPDKLLHFITQEFILCWFNN